MSLQKITKLKIVKILESAPQRGGTVQHTEINTIGLDFNSDPKRKSNKLVKASIGYVESFGFKARIKPDILPAISAADGLAR